MSGKIDANKPLSGLDILNKYVALENPSSYIVKRSLIIAIPLSSIYLFLGFFVPDSAEYFYPLFSILFADIETYKLWVDDHLLVPEELRWNRLVLICYLSLYAGMWWVYFLSKVSKVDEVEAKRLKIQTLRRLLGITSKQWDSNSVHTNDGEIIENFRRKSEVGMMVIAILIAASIIIFDQISSIWLFDAKHSLWQSTILWTGMLSLVISFVCLMFCVDALDTMFNRFANDSIRNSLISYFYNYTINPRYAATATMFLSMILLLAYHSEVLASLAIGIIFCVGYNFWFPDIREEAIKSGLELKNCHRCLQVWCILLVLSIPVLVRVVTYVIYVIYA